MGSQRVYPPYTSGNARSFARPGKRRIPDGTAQPALPETFNVLSTGFPFSTRAFKLVGSAILSLLSQYLLRKERVMGRLVIAVHLGAGRYGKQLRERFFSCVLLLL